MKKALALALSVCMLMSVAVFGGASAATDSNASQPDNTSSSTPVEKPSKSDDGSTGGSTYDPTQTNTNTNTTTPSNTSNRNQNNVSLKIPTTPDEIQKLLDEVSENLSGNTQGVQGDKPISIKLQNPGLIASNVFKQFQESASQIKINDMELPATQAIVIKADSTTSNGTIVGRMYLDASKLTTLGVSIDTTILTQETSKDAKEIARKFQQAGNESVGVVQFGQKGEFGTSIPVAIKNPLSSSNVRLANFNPEKNTYKKLDNPTTLDRNGYVHFEVSSGGTYILMPAK